MHSAPGVIYTTFHHLDTPANVITTHIPIGRPTARNTRSPAVQVSPSDGPSRRQEDYEKFSRQTRIASVKAVE